ncbi:OmpP1/FadL family transporter [Dechloromonas sp. HYN0024]|uniref:OmpP1/FadL family transporter n=1 Tax=Dechloromonas sp. HYN0024 TaxID=2231055 RepID=UPI000E44F649|nr:outer membrane protein transport protein [Dechloromonas sp. HYN0024]AXS79573.1 transporter [Dechloromonas sp. HYN0024]
MNKTNLRLIPALIAIAFSGSAAAAGFQLLGEQNAAGIGNAGAGSAASAENASTIYYNPAGMTQLQGLQVSGGIVAVQTKFEFSNTGSVTPGLTGNGGNGGGVGFVPNAYISWGVTKDIYVGLGIGAPFGLKTEYDNPWIGAAQSRSFEITTMNLNPSVAWRANEWLSVGAGVNWQQIDAKYVRTAAVSANPAATSCTLPFGAGCLTTATLKLSDSSWGWNVGTLLTLAPQTKVGLSYRSKVTYSTSGDVSVSGPAATPTSSSGANAKIALPDMFILSISQGIGERIELLGDVSWTGWSSIPKVDIFRDSGTPLQTLDTKFRDTWRVAVGANYKLNDTIKLKAGVAYDQTPVSSADSRLVSLPDNDRTWFSLGLQWKPSNNMTLDIGGAYLYVKDASINNDQRSATAALNRGLVQGTYSDSAWLFGTQVSMAF